MTSENSPSNVPATDQPFIHFSSAEAVVSALSRACAAPLTTKLAPGSDWKVALTLRFGSKYTPGGPAAQGQHRIGERIPLVGTEAQLAACVGHVGCAVSQCKAARPRDGAFRVGRQRVGRELSRRIGDQPDATDPGRDKAITALQPPGIGIGIEARLQLIEAGEGHRAVGRDILPGVG